MLKRCIEIKAVVDDENLISFFVISAER